MPRFWSDYHRGTQCGSWTTVVGVIPITSGPKVQFADSGVAPPVFAVGIAVILSGRCYTYLFSPPLPMFLAAFLKDLNYVRNIVAEETEMFTSHLQVNRAVPAEYHPRLNPVVHDVSLSLRCREVRYTGGARRPTGSARS